MKKVQPRVAVVDDDGSVLNALRRVLSSAAIEADVFESGSAFVSSLGGSRPDCVILDLQMPGMTGLEVLAHLRSAKLDIPAIILTAHHSPATEQRCLLDGACAYLRKPFGTRTLLDAIEKAVADRRRQRQSPATD